MILESRAKRNVLSCEDIVKIYQEGPVNVTALRGVSTQFTEGKITLVFGPSGSGKTTLLKILGGLDSPSSGKLLFNESNVYSSNQASNMDFCHELVSFIFQEPIYIPFLSVYENIRFPLITRKKQAEEDTINQILASVNLDHKTHSYPDHLSGGEKQRLSLGMAIASNNKIWLCDEPTGSLDFENKIAVIRLIQAINARSNKILVIVSHDPTFLQIADVLLVLKDGTIELELKGGQISQFKQRSGLYQIPEQETKTHLEKHEILKLLDRIREKLL